MKVFRHIFPVLVGWGVIGLALAQAQTSSEATAGDVLPIGLSPDAGLTLAEAMTAAERHSFATRIAAASAEEADERAGQTAAQLGPKLGVDGTNAWISRKVNKLAGETLPNGVSVPNRIANGAVVVTQPVFGIGPLLQKLKADHLNAEALRADQTQSISEARLQGADAYLKALKAARLYEIARLSYALVTKQRMDAASMEKEGKLSAVDVMRLDMATSEAKTQLIQARSLLDVAAIGLVEALGMSRDQGPVNLRASATSNFEEQAPALSAAASLASQAMRHRADLKASGLRIAAAEGYKAVASFDYLPVVNGFARYQRDFTATNRDFPETNSGTVSGHFERADYQDNLTVGLTLNWTLWDWGQRSHRAGELNATTAKAQLAHDALASRIDVEVAQADAELRFAKEALVQAKATVRVAEEIYRAMELKFKNGLATTTDLIVTERDQTRARANLANIRGDLDLAWLRLQKVSGDRVG